MSYIIEVDISNQRDETKMAQYCRTIQNSYEHNANHTLLFFGIS